MAYRTLPSNVTGTLENVLASGNDTDGTDVILSGTDKLYGVSSLVLNPTGDVVFHNPVVLTDDLYCTGNVDISGDIVSIGSQTLSIGSDTMILNAGQTASDAAKNCGITTINTASNSTTSVSFTAGVDGVSNPYITVASVTGFATDCFVLVSSSSGQNNGLYECASVSGSNIHLKSTDHGTTDQDEDFTSGQVVTESSTDYDVSVVDITSMKTNTGPWEVATGSSQPLTFESVTSEVVPAYSAYVMGSNQTITSLVDTNLTGISYVSGSTAYFSLSSSVFTALSNFYVFITANIALSALATTTTGRFYIKFATGSGSAVLSTAVGTTLNNDAGSTTRTLSVSAMAYMTTGNTVRFSAEVFNDASYTVTTSTTFKFTYLSA